MAHPHYLPAPAGSAPGAQVLACGAAGFTAFHNVNCPHGCIVATSAWLLSRPVHAVCWPYHVPGPGSELCQEASSTLSRCTVKQGSPVFMCLRHACLLQAAHAVAYRYRSCRLARAWMRPGRARCGSCPDCLMGRPAGIALLVLLRSLHCMVASPALHSFQANCNSSWLQRVAVKGTPLRVAHYAEADLFAVLASRQVGRSLQLGVGGCMAEKRIRQSRAVSFGMQQLLVAERLSRARKQIPPPRFLTHHFFHRCPSKPSFLRRKRSQGNPRPPTTLLSAVAHHPFHRFPSRPSFLRKRSRETPRLPTAMRWMRPLLGHAA